MSQHGGVYVSKIPLHLHLCPLKTLRATQLTTARAVSVHLAQHFLRWETSDSRIPYCRKPPSRPNLNVY